MTIRQLELSAFLARVYGPERDFDAAVLGIPGDLGLGYLGFAGGGRRTSRRPRIPPRRSGSLPTRCRSRFSITRAGLQGMNRRVKGVGMDLRGELPSVQRWWVAP